jgi:hypothetical protein
VEFIERKYTGGEYFNDIFESSSYNMPGLPELILIVGRIASMHFAVL